MNLIKHATFVPGGMFNTSFMLMMNEGKFNALSAADKAGVLKVSGESFGRMAGRSFDDSDRKGIEAMRAANVDILTADAAFVEQIRTATAPVVDAWVAEAAKKGVDGRAALEAPRAEAKKVAEAKKGEQCGKGCDLRSFASLALPPGLMPGLLHRRQEVLDHAARTQMNFGADLHAALQAIAVPTRFERLALEHHQCPVG